MKKLRIGVGQLWQEQNTFSPILTDIDVYRQSGFVTGYDVFTKYGHDNELGGFLHGSREFPVELVPLLRAWAWPAGYITKETHSFLKNTLLEEIKKAGHLDAMLLSLHGSMAAEDEPDVEGDLLETIHTCTDKNMPIAVSLDLHANITGKMCDHAFFMYAYHTCPHTDLFETGEKTARTLFTCLKNKKKPEVVFTKLPMVTPANLHNTRTGPLKEIFDLVKAKEQNGDVLGISAFPVQPWMDVPEFGWSVLVYTRDGKNNGKKYADELSAEIWKKRSVFFPGLTRIEDIVKQAEEAASGLIVVSDADSTTSGGTGDNACVLKGLLEKKDSIKALATMVDGEIVRRAYDIGEGRDISCQLGGKLDTKYSPTLDLHGNIIKTGTGKFTISGGHIGTIDVDIGKTCVIRFGLIDVLVSEKSGPVYERQIYTHAGLIPEDYRLVVVKSPVGFRDAYEGIAERIYIADCAGIASPNLSYYDFKRIPRPMYPFDTINDWRDTWQTI